MTARIVLSGSRVSGTKHTSVASRSIWASPSVATAMTRASRALPSMRLLISFSYTADRVATATSGTVRIEERDGAVLELARGVTLGVEVADLLDLERAFERRRVAERAADVHEAGRVVVARRHLARSKPRARSLARACAGSRRSAATSSRFGSASQAPQPTGDVGREHDQRRDLGHERLRGGDRHLRPGLQEYRCLGLARYGRADRVRHATTAAPRSAARRAAAIVSAVSPDWVTATTSVRESIGGGL